MPASTKPSPQHVDALSALPAGVLCVDGVGQIAQANDRSRAILEPIFGQLIGRNIAEIFIPIEGLREAALAVDRRERMLTRADGTSLALGYRVGYGGEPGGLLVLFEDISRVAQLRAQRDGLEELATVGRLMPSLLHALRNPLASITSSVELLVDECECPASTEQLEVILGELRRMGLVFQGVGLVGRPLRAPVPGAIDRAIEGALELLKVQAETRNVKLSYDVPTLPPLPLDPAVLRGVVFNLVDNAIRACMAQGSVHVQVRLMVPPAVAPATPTEAQTDPTNGELRWQFSPRPAPNRASLRGARLQLVFCDTGRGMTDAEMAACLRPFSSTCRNGSGLGLSISRKAVEDAGGRIFICSTPGKGSTFSVYIPLHSEESASRCGTSIWRHNAVD